MSGVRTKRGLLDTSVAIELTSLDLERLPEEAAISALTLAELGAGPFAGSGEAEVALRLGKLRAIEASVESLDFDASCARAYGRIYAAARAIGRKPCGANAVDLMIAATALAHELPFYTLNLVDLRGLDGLIEIVDLS